MMENPDTAKSRLDTEFDQLLVDMKPHVLKLPHKTERQRCALWIKKFCEPPGSGVTGRKNRNSYSQLMLHMLKKCILEGPFVGRPEAGPLPTLPAYMSMYFDEGTSKIGQELPDWVTGELPTELASISSIHTDTLGPSHTMNANNPARNNFTSDLLLSMPEPSSGARSRRKNGQDFADVKAEDQPFSRNYEERVPPLFSYDNGSQPHFTTDEKTGHMLGKENHQPWSKSTNTTNDTTNDWKLGTSTAFGAKAGQEDFTISRIQDREVEMRMKMVEARYQEERLRLQQKHDSTVQKILDRKNQEIEELKNHYRSKNKEQEDSSSKLEKKVHQLQAELRKIRDARERDVDQLKNSSDEKCKSLQGEIDKKLSENASKFEQEKFELQKQHTQNIRELLDDTNNRLQRMEDEYSQQMTATSAVIRELENRVQQLSAEIESTQEARLQLEREKAALEGQGDRLHADLNDSRKKYGELERENKTMKEELEHEIRSCKNKHQAELDFLKQVQNNNALKAADTIADLEQHVAQMKVAVESAEQQRQKQIRELEQIQAEDKRHTDSLHEKKVQCLQKEVDQLEHDYQKKTRKLEQNLRTKEEEMRSLREVAMKQEEQSRQALQELKEQVSASSATMFADMKKQMGRVEADLDKSRQMRERQAAESRRLLEEERAKHQHQMTEMKVHFEQEKSHIVVEFNSHKEQCAAEHDKDMENQRETLQKEINKIESMAMLRKKESAQHLESQELQLQQLQQELMQSNQLRKQQLMELGLLREEEKHKMIREHETQVAQLTSSMEQQRLDLQKKHSVEMEKTLEETNQRLKDIEKEYSSRSIKANETIADLQRRGTELKEDLNRREDEGQQRLTHTATRLEEEKRKLKQQHYSTITSLQRDLEGQKTQLRQVERRLTQQEQDYEERLTETRCQYEEKLRGLIPASVRKELEDTITSLRSQVTSMEQRSALLQDELDRHTYYPGVHLGTGISSLPLTSLSSTTSVGTGSLTNTLVTPTSIKSNT